MRILKKIDSLEAIYDLLMGKESENIEDFKDIPYFNEIKNEIDEIKGLAKALSKGDVSTTFDGKSNVASDLKKLQGKMFSLILQNRKYFLSTSRAGDDFFSEFGGSFREMSEKITLLNSIVENTPKINNPVTGLNTRESFEQKATALFEFVKSNHIELMLFKMEIDGYNEMKKAKSKETMDLFNRHYALTVNSLIRYGDLFAHYKDGKYNLAIAGISIENARLLAWRISDRLDKNVFQDVNGGTGFFVKSNIGATMIKKEDKNLEMMFARASQAAKNAKKNGGGYIFFEDIN